MSEPVVLDIAGHQFPTVSVPKGTSVVWHNTDSAVHSAETRADAAFYFTAGAMRQGELSSPIYFGEVGEFPYLCRYHAGMNGVIAVTDSGDVHVTPAAMHDHGTGGHHGSDEHDHHSGQRLDPNNPLNHLHGFVTGGRSGSRIYMTHTPVIADERHCYQVILRAHFRDSVHLAAYDALRHTYGQGKVQLFHEHVSMPDLAAGNKHDLPHCYVSYYPGGEETDAPGFPTDGTVPVDIDAVIHAHQFQPDADYPAGLEYIMYGDKEDVFIDHHIVGAPSFHSVARLATTPDFWDGTSDKLIVTVRSKQIRRLEPKLLPRIAMVDNAFHLVWLPPPGLIPAPTDPLMRPLTSTVRVHQVITSDGVEGDIEIEDSGFLHMDVRLLNYGVLIPPQVG